MTFVEFVAPLTQASYRNKVLAAMYWLHRYEDAELMTTDEIRKLLVSARVPKAKRMNVAVVLNRSGALVDSPGVVEAKRVWRLTDTGFAEVRRLLDLPEAEPEIEHDVTTLTRLAASVADDNARSFIEEAIVCLRFGALRAAVVFLWSGAIRTLHQEAWALGAAKVDAAIRTHDPKARALRKADDFANVKDSVALKAFHDLGMIDKGQRATLEEALNLRNRCGHPTKYRPGEKKTSSFIEDVAGIVF